MPESLQEQQTETPEHRSAAGDNHAQPEKFFAIDTVLVVLALIGLLAGILFERSIGTGPATGYALAISIFCGGWLGLRNALSAIRRGHLSIDALMLLAAAAAVTMGNPIEAAVLLFLFSLSNLLQRYATDRSRRAIGSLLKLRPETARVRRDGEIVTIALSEIAVGEIFLIRPGDLLPLDGIVRRGESSVDQSPITGESIPITRRTGDPVLGGTINGSGALEIETTKPARETALAKMIELVEDAQQEKAQTQRIIDRWEQPYALGVILITLLSIPLFLLREPLTEAFYRSMTLMVAASPCALVLSTPTAILSAIASGARRGVLFKGGVFVEQAGCLKAIAFDKTGTLTQGKTRLTDIRPIGECRADELLEIAAAVQSLSEHHLARATVAAADEQGLDPPRANDFQATIGKGVTATVNNAVIHIGNPSFFEAGAAPQMSAALGVLTELEQAGKTAVMVTRDNQPIGVLAFADTLRPEATRVLRDLRKRGIRRIVMLTGDNAHVASAIAKQAGIDEFHAGLLPAEKVAIVRRMSRETGPVGMIGDGVNDAPALATASVGVAMGAAGTDVALENADLVLMSDDLNLLSFAVELSQKARHTLLTNLGFALAVIFLMVAMILTIGLPLPLAVVGHEGSTVLVSLNGLRLLAVHPRQSCNNPTASA
jgi:Cd2+/Zn2+-exporting ATPase